MKTPPPLLAVAIALAALFAASHVEAQSPPPNADIVAIRAFLESWTTAWSSRDLDGYLAHYAPRFRSGSADLATWSAKKSHLFHKARVIQVTLEDIAVRQFDRTCTVELIQRYTSDTLHDVGFKTLVLELTPAPRIVLESWQPLDQARQLEPSYATLADMRPAIAPTPAEPPSQPTPTPTVVPPPPSVAPPDVSPPVAPVPEVAVSAAPPPTPAPAEPAPAAAVESDAPAPPPTPAATAAPQQPKAKTRASPRQKFSKVQLKTAFGAADEGNKGHLFVDSSEIVFAKNKDGSRPYFSIPTDAVRELFYARVSGRRIGAAILVSPLLLFSKGRKHYVTISFDDGADFVGAIEFKLHKSNYRAALRTLEIVAGVKMEYEQEGIKDEKQQPAESKTVGKDEG